ncbi:MAG TPA: DUF2461 domain-containing protein [Saprospiraceae bacterium]|nr:DUF2461 domain-containing protein [Saprospiraceae bacterium]HNT18846.1 DUF2461 domain-containing protein [Saprospiraceae bacterium]
MAYFDPGFSSFLRNLKKHNGREWFLENKTVYEEKVKKPFEALVAELIYRVHQLEPGMLCTVKDAVFRINRDIRFSKDKSPYKTYVSAVIAHGGRKNLSEPGMYIQLEADRLLIFCGIYMPDKSQLQKIRSAILHQGKEVGQLKSDKKLLALFGSMKGEISKILPPEFREAARTEPLLAHKQFYFESTYPGMEYLQRKDLAAFIMKHYTAARPWSLFLKEAIQED